MDGVHAAVLLGVAADEAYSSNADVGDTVNFAVFFVAFASVCGSEKNTENSKLTLVVHRMYYVSAGKVNNIMVSTSISQCFFNAYGSRYLGFVFYM